MVILGLTIFKNENLWPRNDNRIKPEWGESEHSFTTEVCSRKY